MRTELLPQYISFVCHSFNFIFWDFHTYVDHFCPLYLPFPISVSEYFLPWHNFYRACSMYPPKVLLYTISSTIYTDSSHLYHKSLNQHSPFLHHRIYQTLQFSPLMPSLRNVSSPLITHWHHQPSHVFLVLLSLYKKIKLLNHERCQKYNESCILPSFDVPPILSGEEMIIVKSFSQAPLALWYTRKKKRSWWRMAVYQTIKELATHGVWLIT